VPSPPRAYREAVQARVRAVLDALGDDASARVVRAPGRVNLVGDHTDYNDGFCLPMAIDRDCLVGARPTGDRRVRARSLDVDGVVEWEGEPPATVEPAWGRFVAAAARRTGVTGVDLAVSSTVPLGSGLSSSAALCVALVLALSPDRDPRSVARAARQVEVEASGVPVGLMDQLASTLGRADAALRLDCRTLAVEVVPLPATVRVGVVHSGLPRTLATSEYAARRASCEAAARRLGVASLRDARPDQVADDPLARHVVSENGRVLEAAAALRAGDVEQVGRLLVASHESLRDDFAVSTPELDRLVDLLLEEGALGARLTGAGFGGCVVALTAAADAAALDRAAQRYAATTRLQPRAFPVRAVDGAGPVRVS
jgi:galactokinase